MLRLPRVLCRLPLHVATVLVVWAFNRAAGPLDGPASYVSTSGRRAW